jgi:hypothetical protein
MMASGQERTALLIIRLWRERSDQPGFRARVTQTRDIEAVPEQSTVARSLPQLLDTVRRWAVAFEREGTEPQAPGDPSDEAP